MLGMEDHRGFRVVDDDRLDDPAEEGERIDGGMGQTNGGLPLNGLHECQLAERKDRHEQDHPYGLLGQRVDVVHQVACIVEFHRVTGLDLDLCAVLFGVAPSLVPVEELGPAVGFHAVLPCGLRILLVQ